MIFYGSYEVSRSSEGHAQLLEKIVDYIVHKNALVFASTTDPGQRVGGVVLLTKYRFIIELSVSFS